MEMPVLGFLANLEAFLMSQPCADVASADQELIICNTSKSERAGDCPCSCDRLTRCCTAPNASQAKIKLKFPSMIF